MAWVFKVGYLYTLPHGGVFKCVRLKPNGNAMMETIVAMERDDRSHSNFDGIMDLEYRPNGCMPNWDNDGDGPMMLQREIEP